MIDSDTKLYACLLGEWVELTNDSSIQISAPEDKYMYTALEWLETPTIRPFVNDGNFWNLSQVEIIYKGLSYRIHPSMLQIVIPSNKRWLNGSKY